MVKLPRLNDDDDDTIYNEYLELPDDPEEGFAVLQRRKLKALNRALEQDDNRDTWYHENLYIDSLLSYDSVHNLDILVDFRDRPNNPSEFNEYFKNFRSTAEISSHKILIEAARRQKQSAERVVVLDSENRKVIHKLINSIREKLNNISLSDDKRDALFNRLNAFAAEIDRDRTRLGGFYSFAVDMGRLVREAGIDFKPLQETVDRLAGLLDKAPTWGDVLPPWKERRQIEGPRKHLPAPKEPDDEDIPF